MLAQGAPLAGSLRAAETKPAAEPKPSIDEAYRAWAKGLASTDADERLKTLKSMLPTKADVTFLFPDAVEKLWPLLDQNQKRLEEHVDDLAREIGGEKISKIEVIDVRQHAAPKRFEALLSMVPKDLPICRLIVQRDKGGGGSGCYVYRDGRWFWFQGLESIPEFLGEKRP